MSIALERPAVLPRHSYRYVIEVLIFLTYAVFGMSWAAAGTFLKQFMLEQHLTLSQASFMNTIVSCAKIFGPVLAGALMARLGLRWAFMLASSLICLGILAALSTSYPLILTARFAMGIGGAMVVVYFTPLVMQWFTGSERLVVNGLNFVAINTGMMVAIFATPSLQRALGGSWQSTLVAYSLVSVALAVAWLVLGREGAPQAGPAASGAAGGYAAVLRDRHTWILSLAGIGSLSMYLTIITYFPTFYRELFGASVSPAVAFAPGIAMAVGIPASILGIFLTRRTGLRLPLLKGAGLVLLPVMAGMFLVKIPAVIVACAALTGLCLFIGVPAFYSIPQELPGTDAARAGYMMAVFWAMCYVAATFNVWFVGRIVESTGGNFAAGFSYVLAVGAVSLTGLWLLPETGPGAARR